MLPVVALVLLGLGLLLLTSPDTLRGGATAAATGVIVALLVLVRARWRLRRLGEDERRVVAGLGWWARLRTGFVDPVAEQVPAGWGLAIGALVAVAVGLAVLTAPADEPLGPAPALAVLGVVIAALDGVRLTAARRRGRSP